MAAGATRSSAARASVTTHVTGWSNARPALKNRSRTAWPILGLLDLEGQPVRTGSCPGEEEQLLLLEVDLPGDLIAPVLVRVREGLRQLLGVRDFGGLQGHPACLVAAEPLKVDHPDER